MFVPCIYTCTPLLTITFSTKPQWCKFNATLAMLLSDNSNNFHCFFAYVKKLFSLAETYKVLFLFLFLLISFSVIICWLSWFICILKEFLCAKHKLSAVKWIFDFLQGIYPSCKIWEMKSWFPLLLIKQHNQQTIQTLTIYKMLNRIYKWTYTGINLICEIQEGFFIFKT